MKSTSPSHRNAVNTVRNKFLRKFIQKVDTRLKHLAHIELAAATTREKTAAQQRKEKKEVARFDNGS